MLSSGALDYLDEIIATDEKKIDMSLWGFQVRSFEVPKSSIFVPQEMRNPLNCEIAAKIRWEELDRSPQLQSR